MRTQQHPKSLQHFVTTSKFHPKKKKNHFFLFLFLFFAVLACELKAFILSHSTSPFFVMGIFEI
jgi:hypothetical protein